MALKHDYPHHKTNRNSTLGRMSTAACALGLLFLWLPGLVFAAPELKITIEGLPKELADAARGSLILQQYAGRDVTNAQVRRLFKNGTREIQKSMEPYGHYQTSVESELKETPKGFEAIYRVNLGPPTLVTESRVEVLGAGKEQRAVQRAIRRFAPAKGDRLDHGVYEQSKNAIESALLGAGYLRAEPKTHRVEVTRAANSATIDLSFTSGDRYRFGDVRFEENQFRPEFLERFIPWEPNDYYSPDKLLELQQRLVDADYFASVTVQPDLEQARVEGVPINVSLAPAKRSVYTAGVYFSTDTGPGARLGLDRRWVNDKGHKFKAELDNAERRQSASLGYQIPLPGPNEKSLNFGATYRDENTATSQSRLTRFAANETRRWMGFTRTLGLQYSSGTFEIADDQSYSTLLYAEGTLTKKVANNPTFPRRGYSLAFGTRFAAEGLVTDTSFSQFTADAKWIRGVARRQRVLLRGSVGAMAVDDFSQLPPELRFFAGGDRSIRGFDYQQLGTTNDAGKVIGGEFLAVASAEYEYFFLPRWGAAVFVDGGDAFRSGEFDLNIGAGFGLRWRSPVGMLRLDIAKPVSSDLADVIRLHISIGPDL